MNNFKTTIYELKTFILLWLTQSLSTLGSMMTSFALVVWSYGEKGSALTTALLSVSSYVPYVLVSIFAGTLSDRWSKKKIMLISDTFAALTTAAVLVLLNMDRLEMWHLYVINALNGLMNTVQKPAADVAVSLLTPKKHYQRVSGMQSFSNSLHNILAPALAGAVLSFAGINAVIAIDLITFAAAFITLLFFIKIPYVINSTDKKDSIFKAAAEGIAWLKNNRGIMDLMLFLAAINFTASMFDALLPAYTISVNGNGAYGTVSMVTGLAMLFGSITVTFLPKPQSRVKVICYSLLLSMSTENFILSLSRSLPVWCIGAALGWIAVPVMNANMTTLFREKIPVEIQGRVYSVRNSLQFFTIPIGFTVGGFLADKVFEPFMAGQTYTLLNVLFGSGKGSGAAFMLLIMGFMGVITCIVFIKNKNIKELEREEE